MTARTTINSLILLLVLSLLSLIVAIVTPAETNEKTLKERVFDLEKKVELLEKKK